MIYIQKFYEQTFCSENSKQAYMKACKFVAKNILNKGSKVEADKVTWKVKRVEDNKNGLPTFQLTLYYTFDDTQFMEQTCNACRSFHSSVYINENYNCDRCNKVAYEKGVHSKLTIGADYFKKMLDDELSRL